MSGQFRAVAKNSGAPGFVWKVEVTELGTRYFGDQLVGVLLVSGEDAARDLAAAVNQAARDHPTEGTDMLMAGCPACEAGRASEITP